MKPTLDRRALLTGGLALGGGLLLGPAADGADRRTAPRRRLVIVQLSGGNDGLSTVVPHGDDAYRRVRDTIQHRKRDLHVLDDYRGLHGSLAGLSRQWDAGQLAIVEGVGYPEMVRSHFKAFEIWHTADRRGRAAGDGWVGRLAAHAWAEEDSPELIVHLGGEAPWSVRSRAHPPVAMDSPTGYRWFGGQQEDAAYCAAGESLERQAEHDDPAHAGRDRALARLRGVLDDARASSSRIRRAAAAYRPTVEYPREGLAAKLRDVAALIHGGLGTRVFSVALRGFDTHADQRGDHDGLMRTLDAALAAFVADLAGSEAGRATLVLVFSEFGRRVRENGSGGTDHGKAGPAFLLGPAVRGGLYGAHPSLTDLDAGDLAWTTDFRSLYGEVIEGWFGTPMERVLGDRYPRLGALA